MKKIILIMATIVTIIACDAGISNAGIVSGVPDAVLKSFSQQYPNGVAIRWDVKNDTCQAMFIMERIKMHAWYLMNGSWIKTETRIPWSKDLPYTVRSSWGNSQFGSWYIDNIEKVESPGREEYAVQVHNDYGPDGSIPGDLVDVYRLYFYDDGTLVREEQIE